MKVVTNQPPTHSTSTESISSSPTKVHALQSTEQTTTDDKSTSCLLQSSSTNGTGDSPQDCSSINSGSCVSGSYDICLDGQEIDSVPIYCECTTEGIWTVIQKRFDGSVDFYRNWTDYKEGFGEVSGEYWLGNDIIHQLTSRSKYALKFVLTDWDNVTKYARYNRFEIADEAGRYRLSIGGYSGDAGNSVENHHDGRHFTTKDRDNDALYTGDNCAVRHTGAWWYGQCYDSNLNGPYRFGPTIPNGAGIIWRTWHGPRYSLKATKMMIRKA